MRRVHPTTSSWHWGQGQGSHSPSRLPTHTSFRARGLAGSFPRPSSHAASLLHLDSPASPPPPRLDTWVTCYFYLPMPLTWGWELVPGRRRLDARPRLPAGYHANASNADTRSGLTAIRLGGAPKSKGPSLGHHPAWGDKQAHCRSIDLGIASQLAGALPAS